MKPGNRNFKGVWIPAYLWLDKTLSLQEKAFLIEIDSLSANPKGCYASNNYFGDFFNLSKSRVSEIINKLKEKGRIEITYKYEGKRCLERWIRVFGKQTTPYSGNRTGVFGKPKVSNIVNNKKEGFLEIWEKQGFKTEKEMNDHNQKNQFKDYGIGD